VHKVVAFTTCVLLLATSGALRARQARSEFGIHAASDKAVPGWLRMQYENDALWINPLVTLRASDILSAVENTEPDGRLSVAITFTDAGAQKMRNLSAAQSNKFIAMVLDGRVIFARRVRGEMGKEVQIPVSEAFVDKLLAAINDAPDDLPVRSLLK
jgi:preprotein translocase subunit SecD